MTNHQAQKLIESEIQRHIALAVVAREPSIKASHMEVLQALTIDELKTRYEQGYLFAAKDEDGKAFVFTARPTKGKASWINDDDTSTVRRLRYGFDALSFDDDNPLEIASLLDRLGVEA